jgi:quinol monooxygenase YgiN
MAKPKARKAARRKKSSRRVKPLPMVKLPKGAVMLLVMLRPREGQDLLLEAELRALVAPTRKEEGCLAYELHRSVDPPSAFLLREIWLTRDAHTQHTRSPHFLRWNARKDALVVSREAAFWQQIV